MNASPSVYFSNCVRVFVLAALPGGRPISIYHVCWLFGSLVYLFFSLHLPLAGGRQCGGRACQSLRRTTVF